MMDPSSKVSSVTVLSFPTSFKSFFNSSWDLSLSSSVHWSLGLKCFLMEFSILVEAIHS